MNPVLAHLAHPVDRWQEVIDALHDVAAKCTLGSPLPELPKNAQERYQVWYAHHVPLVVVAMARSEEELSRIPDEARALLHVMTREALFFLRGIVLETNEQSETIFPWPGGEPGDVALWFLTDWWPGYGLKKWMASVS